MKPDEIPQVEDGTFTRCPECRQWWWRLTPTGALVGPVDDVSSGPMMDTVCPLCVAARAKNVAPAPVV